MRRLTPTFATGLLAVALSICSVGGASAAAEIDRFRCKVDQLVDDLGNPFNHVQMQVKVAIDIPTEAVNVWVTNEFGQVSPIHVGVLPVDGTGTAEWDSSPDVISPDVLIIDPGFADAGEQVTATVVYTNDPATPIPSMSVECRLKTRQTFRQDTKPCKQKDFDRGRCSPVTEP